MRAWWAAWWAALTAAALARAAALTPTETALWTWAEAQGANVSRVVPTTGVYGRGLAAVDGSQGELLSLPRHLIMGCEAVARVALELPGVVAFTGCEDGVGRTSMRFAGGFEAWDGNTLVVFVAHHRLLGAASPWAPYLDSLPASFDTLPPYLLAVAAVGGSAAEAVRAMDAADAFEGGALRDVVQKEASKWLYFSRLVAAAFADHAGVEATRALRTVLWAKAVVATRAVHLSSLGRSLVPFWDLINHGAYAAKREVVDDERVAYIRDAPSDGGELVHDYQLSSSTGGACAWDWLITFGFVPRDAQKVVACARVRVRGEVFELPADAAALARLDGEDARRALEGALLALPPEDALRDDTGDAAYVKLLERRALLDALRGGAPKEVLRHAVVVDGRAETINYAPCGNITKAARAFVDEHLTDLTDEARRDHVNRLRPMLASKIDDHACASKRADDGETWLHEETRVISVIGYSTPVSGHDLVTFTHLVNLEARAAAAAARTSGVGGLGCVPGDVGCLKDIFVRRGRELAEAQRQKMAGEGTFVGEKFGCALNGEGPAPSVDVAFARLVTKWTRVAVTVATRDVLDFAASWGRGLLDAGAPQFVVAVYDEDVAATLTKAVGAERVARVAAGTTLAALARAAHDLGKDVLATVPEIGFRGDPWPALARRPCGAQLLPSGFEDSTAERHLADEVRRWSSSHQHNPFLTGAAQKRAHWRHVVGVAYLRANDPAAAAIADAWARYASNCAFHAALEAALAEAALAGFDFCGLRLEDGFATPFHFWMMDAKEKHFRWFAGDWTSPASDNVTLVYPARLDAAWFEDGHLIPPLVDATCLASKREVLRTAGAWFGRGTEEPPPRFLPGGRESPRNEVTFALYETDAGKRCRTAYFDKIWTEFTRHPQRATTAEDVTFVLTDLDSMMWSWPHPNIGLAGPTSWVAGDRPTCYPWPFTGQLMMAPSLSPEAVANALKDPRQRPPHIFGARTPADRPKHAADALLAPASGLGTPDAPLVVFNFAAPICVVVPAAPESLHCAHVDEVRRPGVVQAFVGAATTHFVPFTDIAWPAPLHPRFDEKAARAAPDTGACDRAARPVFASILGTASHAVRATLAAALANQTDALASARDPTKDMADGRTGGERDDYLKSRLDALRCERVSPDAAVAVMACSRFVLAPRGHMLHSSRLLEALSIGAVPVVVSDGWVLPFEHDLVDWAAVAIRVAEADAGRVADILRTVSDERWCAMQRAGRRAYADILSKPVDALVRVFEKRRATSDS